MPDDTKNSTENGPPPQGSEKNDSSTSGGTQAEGTTGENSWQMPEINFATFILSLNHSTLVHLGIIDDPATGKKTKNLVLAKQTIDILAVLEEKTKGNLTEDEATMLKNILYDLRIIYIREKG
jgi:hypothetical protein